MERIEEEKYKGLRADKLLNLLLKDDISGELKEGALLSRNFASLNVDKVLYLNDKPLKKSYKVKEGDAIYLDRETLLQLIKERISQFETVDQIRSETGVLKIVSENENHVVIDKPHGMVVHPGHNNRTGTLANLFKGYLEGKGEYDPMLERAGVVHRLDKAVGGLILLAKNRHSQLYYKRQFENHQVLKVYECEVEKIEDTKFVQQVEERIATGDSFSKNEILKNVGKGFLGGSIDSSDWIRVGGYIARDPKSRIKMSFSYDIRPKSSPSWRTALSYIYPLSSEKFLIRIESGRMHQIRATLRALGYVIKGDLLYKTGKWSKVEKIELRSIMLGLREVDGASNIIRL